MANTKAAAEGTGGAGSGQERRDTGGSEFPVKIRKLGEHWKTTLSPTEARPTVSQDEADEHALSHMAAGYEALVEEIADAGRGNSELIEVFRSRALTIGGPTTFQGQDFPTARPGCE